MQSSYNQNISTNVPGNRNQRASDAIAGAAMLPHFHWSFSGAATDQAILIGFPTGSGDRLIRIPYRIVDDADPQSNGVRFFETRDEWKVDLNETTINMNTLIGGIVDGVGNVASRDYFVWAFFDPYDPDGDIFKGFGITARPHTTGTLSGTINRGASGTITTPTNDAHRFTIGARIIVRAGTLSGTIYNQAIITAIPAHNQLSVTMDAAYTAANEGNSNLTAGSYEVFQTDFMRPYVKSGTRGIYQGYTYTYMGHLQTTAGTPLVSYVRYRGDPYLEPSGQPRCVLQSFAGAGNQTYSTSLCRYVAYGHPQRVLLALFGRVTSGSGTTGRVGVGIDATRQFLITSEVRGPTSSDFYYDSMYAWISPRENTILVRIDAPTGTTIEATAYFTGYEWEWEF